VELVSAKNAFLMLFAVFACQYQIIFATFPQCLMANSGKLSRISGILAGNKVHLEDIRRPRPKQNTQTKLRKNQKIFLGMTLKNYVSSGELVFRCQSASSTEPHFLIRIPFALSFSSATPCYCTVLCENITCENGCAMML